MSEHLEYSLPVRPKQAKGWRLVVSDLDGTLLDEQGRIPPANLEAVDHLRRIGIGFTVASGRHFQMARHVARQLQIDLPIIACNGALIGDSRTGRIIRRECLPKGAALAVTRALLDLSVDFVCYATDRVYYWRESGRVEIIRGFNALAGVSVDGAIPLIPGRSGVAADGAIPLIPGRSGVAADGAIPLIPLGDPAVCPDLAEWVKIVLSVPDAATTDQVAALLAGQPDLDSVMSQNGVLELNAAGTSKGTALRYLAGLLKIRLDEVVAFGDHDNDVTLLAAAGLGIAVANATPAAIAASQMRTSAHHEAGVADAIRRLFG